MLAPIYLLRLPDIAPDSEIRAAIISVLPAIKAGQWLIREARGQSLTELSEGFSYGPFHGEALADKLEQQLLTLSEQGFVQTTVMELLLALQDTSATRRARAAIRLGWRKQKQAAPFLLVAAQQAKGDICAILDALGHIGDASAITLLREYATRKNLSRRRSAIEALRNCDDKEGLILALKNTLQRLPEKLQQLLQVQDENIITTDVVATFNEIILSEPTQKRGLIIELLYERNTPLGNTLVKQWVQPEEIRLPHRWRYAKSMLKRAKLREDMPCFALLAYHIEVASYDYTGQYAVVKSGYDGKKRKTLIFGKKTQQYIRRSNWRYLKDLAFYRPQKYLQAVCFILSHYDNTKVHTDSRNEYLLNQILYNNSQRLTVNYQSLTHKAKNAQSLDPDMAIHEEAFSPLWQQYPEYYIDLLTHPQRANVQQFALRGLDEHPDLLISVSNGQLWRIVNVGYIAVITLVLAELERRFRDDFQKNKPNLELLQQALQQTSTHESVRHLLATLCISWLKESQKVWSVSGQNILSYVQAKLPKVSWQVARLALPSLLEFSIEDRQLLAKEIAKKLAEPEVEEGVYAPLIFLVKATLSKELSQCYGTQALLDLISHATKSQKEVAALVLVEKQDLLEVLKIVDIIGMANHEILTIRKAAQAIFERYPEILAQDKSPLYTLCDSEWMETRAYVRGHLEKLPFAEIGFDGIIGLCDSAREDVRALGLTLISKYFTDLPSDTLLFRLAEHPEQSIRCYVLTLIQYLDNDLSSLRRIESFIRVSLLDMRPSRKLKYGIIDFLLQRSLLDEAQACYVAALFCEFLRTHTQGDFQRIVAALAQIQILYPNIQSDLQMMSESSL